MKHVRDLILETRNILKQINYKLRHSILPHNCFELFKCDVVVLLFLSIFDISRDEVLENWIVEDVFVVVSRWVFATHLRLQFIQLGEFSILSLQHVIVLNAVLWFVWLSVFSVYLRVFCYHCGLSFLVFMFPKYWGFKEIFLLIFIVGIGFFFVFFI